MNIAQKVWRKQLLVRAGTFLTVLSIGAYIFLQGAASYLTFFLCSVGIVLASIEPFLALETLLLALPLHTFMLVLVQSFSTTSPNGMLLFDMWQEIVLVADI